MNSSDREGPTACSEGSGVCAKTIPILPWLVVFLFSGNPELELHLSAFIMYWIHSFECIHGVRLIGLWKFCCYFAGL